MWESLYGLSHGPTSSGYFYHSWHYIYVIVWLLPLDCLDTPSHQLTKRKQTFHDLSQPRTFTTKTVVRTYLSTPRSSNKTVSFLGTTRIVSSASQHVHWWHSPNSQVNQKYFLALRNPQNEDNSSRRPTQITCLSSGSLWAQRYRR